MKALLINGSPHHHGCTYTALCEVSDTLNQNGIDTDIFWIGNREIRGCIGCRQCRNTGHCIFDDKVNEFLEIAADYDAYVFGCPVYFASVPGGMTSFMDRVFFSDFNGGGNRMTFKPVAAVVSARRAGTTVTLDQLNRYFGLMQMPMITSRYWHMVHGGTPEEILQDKEGMQSMRMLAHNMAFWMKCRDIGVKSGIPLPPQEPLIHTNFIR